MAETEVEIFAAPIIASISGEGSYCQGADVLLSASNTTGTTGIINYTWTGPNGFLFTGTDTQTGSFELTLPNVDPTFEGIYTLELESANGCISIQESININIGALPVTPDLQVNNDIICEGNVLELNTLAYTGTTVTYEWFIDNGLGPISIAVTDIPTYFIDSVSFSDEGIYTVEVTIDGCLSLASNAQNVSIFANIVAPTPNNTTSISNPACEGETVMLNTPMFTGATYEWFGPNGFTSTQPNLSLIHI